MIISGRVLLWWQGESNVNFIKLIFYGLADGIMKNNYKFLIGLMLLLLNGMFLFAWDTFILNIPKIESRFLVTPNGSHIIWAWNRSKSNLMINNIKYPEYDTNITFQDFTNPMCISDDSKLLAIEHDSATIKVINLETKEIVYSISNDSLDNISWTNSFFVNDNKDLLIYSSAYRTRININLESRKISIDTTRQFACFSDNAEFALFISAPDSLEIWNFRENKFIKSMKLKDRPHQENSYSTSSLYSIKISNDGKYFVYFDSAKSVRLYNRAKDSSLIIDELPGFELVYFKFDNKNESFVYFPITNYGDSIINYKIDNGAKVKRSINYRFQPFDYFWKNLPEDDFSISGDLKTISYFAHHVGTSMGAENISWKSVDILDFQSNALLRNQLDHHTSLIMSSDLNISKNMLATSADEVYLWNSQTGRLLKKLTYKGELTFSPDEKFLFIVQNSVTIKIDLSVYQIVDTVEIEGDTILSLFTFKNQNTILCQTDKNFYLLKYPELTVIKKFPHYFELVNPDYTNENFIAVMGNKIQLYSFNTGELIREKELDSTILLNRNIEDVTNDMRYLAVIEKTDNQEYKYHNSFYGFIWDLDKNEKVIEEKYLIDYTFIFTPDNKHVSLKYLYPQSSPIIAYVGYDLVNRRYSTISYSTALYYSSFFDNTYLK